MVSNETSVVDQLSTRNNGAKDGPAQPAGRHRYGDANRTYCRDLIPMPGQEATTARVRPSHARSRLHTLTRIAATSGIISVTVIVVVSAWFAVAGANAVAQMTAP